MCAVLVASTVVAAVAVSHSAGASAAPATSAIPSSSELDQTAIIDAGEYLTTAFSDGTYAYVAGNSVPARVTKIRLADATVVDVIALYAFPVDSVLLNRVEVATSDGTHGYFATRDGIVVKVRLSDMTVVDSLDLELELGETPSAAVSDGTFAYFGTSISLDRTPRILRVRMSDLSMSSVAVIPFNSRVTSALFDGTHLYFTSGSDNFAGDPTAGQLFKVSTPGFGVVQVGSLGFDPVVTGVVQDGFLYYPTDTNPAKVLKIRASDLQAVATVEVPAAYVAASAADGANLYLVTYPPVGVSGDYVANSLVQVRLTDFAVTGRVTDTEGAHVLSYGAVSSASFVWTTGYSSPGTFQAVRTAARGVTSCGFADASSIPSSAREGACWLKDRKVTTNNPFNPSGLVTRAQMASFLWRAAGRPPTQNSCGFSDQARIPTSAQQGACWLKANGITTSNPFNPSGLVTRAQMASFLWRAAGSPTVGSAPCPSVLSDYSAIPTSARPGACWLKFHGITTNNPFNPRGTVTRAQMAAFLLRSAYLVPTP